MIVKFLKFKQAHNISLPQWILDNYQKIMAANNFGWQLDYETVEMAKLTSGGLLNSIVVNINSKVQGSAFKFFHFSII